MITKSTHVDSTPGLALPAVLRIVLTQVATHRMQGRITAAKFNAAVARISDDLLKPQGLVLLVRELACGSTRFIVKAQATGRVCDMMEIAPQARHRKIQ